MESQFLEGGANGHAGLLPKTPAERAERVKQVRDDQAGRFRELADRFRSQLKDWYGPEQGMKVRHAEAVSKAKAEDREQFTRGGLQHIIRAGSQ